MSRPFVEILAAIAFAAIVAFTVAVAGTALAAVQPESPEGDRPDPLTICWQLGDLRGCVREES